MWELTVSEIAENFSLKLGNAAAETTFQTYWSREYRYIIRVQSFDGWAVIAPCKYS